MFLEKRIGYNVIIILTIKTVANIILRYSIEPKEGFRCRVLDQQVPLEADTRPLHGPVDHQPLVKWGGNMV